MITWFAFAMTIILVFTPAGLAIYALIHAMRDTNKRELKKKNELYALKEENRNLRMQLSMPPERRPAPDPEPEIKARAPRTIGASREATFEISSTPRFSMPKSAALGVGLPLLAAAGATAVLLASQKKKQRMEERARRLEKEKKKLADAYKEISKTNSNALATLSSLNEKAAHLSNLQSSAVDGLVRAVRKDYPCPTQSSATSNTAIPASHTGAMTQQNELSSSSIQKTET